MPCVCLSVSKAQMELMSWPVYLTGEVPCVFAWLSSCLRGQEVPPFPYLPGICERTKLIVLVNSNDFFFKLAFKADLFIQFSHHNDESKYVYYRSANCSNQANRMKSPKIA